MTSCIDAVGGESADEEGGSSEVASDAVLDGQGAFYAWDSHKDEYGDFVSESGEEIPSGFQLATFYVFDNGGDAGDAAKTLRDEAGDTETIKQEGNVAIAFYEFEDAPCPRSSAPSFGGA